MTGLSIREAEREYQNSLCAPIEDTRPECWKCGRRIDVDECWHDAEGDPIHAHCALEVLRKAYERPAQPIVAAAEKREEWGI